VIHAQIQFFLFWKVGIQVISTIKDKAKNFLTNSKKIAQKMTSIENEKEIVLFDDLISHDPGKRGPVTSPPQRQYLINLGPYQPKLSKFPINLNINESKQNHVYKYFKIIY